jgi:hypothetical protein
MVTLRHIDRAAAVSEDDRLRLESIEWLCDLPLQHGESVKARINFAARKSVSDVSIGIGFSNRDGKRLLTYETDFQEGYRPKIDRPGAYAVEVEIESLPLAPDLYDLDIGCRSGDSHPLDYIAGAFQVEIVSGPATPGSIVRKDAGVRLASKWNHVEPTQAAHRGVAAI